MKLTTKDVIKEFKKVHGNKYDYSKVKYVNSNTSVKIVCSDHGEFLQRASHHRNGVGCPKCAGRGLTTKELILEFKKVHGDKYDYSKVNYIKGTTPVTIICPEHGKFLQTPSEHKSGKGCAKCGGRVKLTTDEVIKDFKKVHGKKYDYSKVEYKNTDTKVIIICKKHGEFEQLPYAHKKGAGCPVCSGNIKHSLEQVVQDFRKVHGDKYDYSKVVYKNNMESVIIICPEHGEFLQTPGNHKSGQGCSKCIGKMLLTQEEVIRDFKETHGDRFDYSKVNYVNAKTYVTIVCKVHGDFLQLPDSHKRGTGCPKCLNQGLTQDDVINAFKARHGNRYNYSKVHYLDHNTKVKIICPDHGEFLQTPTSHKAGTGCPRCAGHGITTKELIQEFKALHGDKYDYSNVVYVTAKVPVIIRCKIHGEFLQTPDKHKSGSGCPTCTRGWTKPKILEFLHSIENQDLLQMDAVELQMIINQGKLPETFRDLVFADEDNKENTLKALKERLEAELESAEFEELEANETQEEDWNQDEVEREDIEINDKQESNESAETEKQQKKLISLSNTNEDLHVLDHDLVSSCDAEVIEFLIQYKLRKIWNQVLNQEFSVKQFKAETGGANFTLLQKYFFDEYNEVLKYKPPVGYEFPYAP
ncbi:MAG: hypothetical protein KA146_12560, partial [Leptospiraceae bacterium]|nr:hypothetical protein [Leptospiraceae bacterium]